MMLMVQLPGQIITTIAGNGTSGYTGDNGSAFTAELNIPFFITTDKYYNIIFSDQGNSVVRKINSSNIITTIAGTGVAGYSGDGGLATSARINKPMARICRAALCEGYPCLF